MISQKNSLLYLEDISLINKLRISLQSINQITINLLFSRLSLKTKRKLLYVYKFSPSIKRDLLKQAKSYPNIISHLYEMLFLLTSNYGHRKVNISKVNDYYNITICENTETYKFMLNLFPSPGIPISNDLTPLVDIFSGKFYDYYPIKGKIVDIGGYIGDTAVYFIKKGAEFIEVYEPNPYNFKLMISNIVINNATANIKPINSAISKDTGESVLHVPKFIAGAASLYEYGGKAISINVNTISCQEVLNKHIDLLKMDCKGCELDIILYCGQQLKENVDHLIFQYSDMSEKSLATMLEKLRNIGFIVDKVDHDFRMVYAQMFKRKSSN